MENDELLHKWVNGTLSPEELKAFKGRSEYASLEKLKRTTDRLTVPKLEKEQMLSHILAQDKGNVKPLHRAKRRYLPGWLKYAAAVAILVFGVWFFWPSEDYLIFATAKLEQKEGQLPDGSTFLLNAESSLTYAPENWDKDRVLTLKGEAFFEVEKGHPFKVLTDNGMVKVIGTSFNVWARGNTLKVRCKSGKVDVSTAKVPTGNVLTANEAIRFTNEELVEKWETSTQENASWIAGISRFRKVPLQTVIDELERQFDVRIDASQIDTTEIISCNFDHQDLELALQTSIGLLGIRIEFTEDNTIVLYKE